MLKHPMKKPGIAINSARCMACYACFMACKDEHCGWDTDLSKSQPEMGQYWMNIKEWERGDNERHIKTATVPTPCSHCDNPACVAACPTGASYIAEDGTVQIDDEKCVGCDACVAACPYEARYHVDDENIVRKCTFCHHRTQLGMLPACVGACVAGARMFGDLNDPDSDISKAIAAAGETDVLLPEEGLGPEIHYIGLNSALAMKRVSNVQQGGNVKTPYEM